MMTKVIVELTDSRGDVADPEQIRDALRNQIGRLRPCPPLRATEAGWVGEIDEDWLVGDGFRHVSWGKYDLYVAALSQG